MSGHEKAAKKSTQCAAFEMSRHEKPFACFRQKFPFAEVVRKATVLKITIGNSGGVAGLSIGGFCVAKIFLSEVQRNEKKSRLVTWLEQGFSKARFLPCPQ